VILLEPASELDRNRGLEAAFIQHHRLFSLLPARCVKLRNAPAPRALE
jgi:hypothetical protein